MREELIRFLKHLREYGYELAKHRQMSCGEYAWLPITDILYRQKIEDIVDSHIVIARARREHEMNLYCTCDDHCDDPCPVHYTEHKLREALDRALCAWKDLKDWLQARGAEGRAAEHVVTTQEVLDEMLVLERQHEMDTPCKKTPSP